MKNTPGTGTYNVYVNADSKASGMYSGLTQMGEFADIGNDANPNSRNYAFDGMIDDVRMYNYALTESEVSNLHIDGQDTTPPSTPQNLQIVIQPE